jgi:hypothetical protein
VKKEQLEKALQVLGVEGYDVAEGRTGVRKE